MIPKSKVKEKILIEEELTTKEQEDIEVTITEAINRITRIIKEKKSLQELIDSITTTTAPLPASVKKTPTKSSKATS